MFFNCTTAPPAAGQTGCIPFDIFNINEPNTVALMKSASINPISHFMFQYKAAGADDEE